MKKTSFSIFKSSVIMITLLSSLLCNSFQVNSVSYNLPDKNLSCTNFGASFGDTVLFGNSEDGGLSHPLGQYPESTRMFYYGAGAEGYGCAFVGWYWEEISVSIQGGMNDQGLCYDLTGIPDTPVNTPPNPTYTVAGSWIMKDVLRLNANVSEVIDFFKSADWSGYWWFQWLFVDALGEVVIISPGTDGELVFTRKVAGEDGFLTQTNFNRANNKSGTYPCWRYEASYEILSEIENEEDLTTTKFNEVLDAVHFYKGGSFTHYSNTFDPVNKMLYLNYMGNFDETATINVTEELEDLYFKAVPMSDYFSEDTVENGFENYKKWKRAAIFKFQVLPISAIVLTVIGIGVGIYFLIRKLKKRKIAKNI
ncbi:MAG: hypothetical protein H7641_14970 [Candidatus Heimdallarchaeota archaeon]|nr:hypothetical protein [Candidatus Heimdallarchaeota archaeon]MCK4878865.1 hypothetical protein [Candidatus Heimdallarchaeota archaeon]